MYQFVNVPIVQGPEWNIIKSYYLDNLQVGKFNTFNDILTQSTPRKQMQWSKVLSALQELTIQWMS